MELLKPHLREENGLLAAEEIGLAGKRIVGDTERRT